MIDTCVFTTVLMNSSITTMENRDCLRRIARHEEPVFSNQSIMNVMEKFVKSVNNMDETILVPCRLMDLKVGDASDTVLVKSSQKHSGSKRPVQNITSTDTDLFNLYTMINSVKNELLWSQKSDREQNSVPTPIATVAATTTTTAAVTKGHARRPSSASLTSTNSAASSISDTESDAGNENDSGIEAEENVQPKDYTQQVADNFRQHLKGLYHSLEQMTEAATYLTTRYQNDVGGAV